MDSNTKAFRVCIAALFKSFGSEATEAAYDGYFLGLGDIPIESLRVAVARSIRECRFLPKPYEIRKLAGCATSPEDRAISAWSDVLNALNYGVYKTVDFQDKICNAVVRNLGGWPTFCSRFTDSEAEKWVRIEFLKAYQSFVATGVNGAMVAPLPGLSQAEVVNGQLVSPVPRIVACETERARLSVQSIRNIEVNNGMRRIGQLAS